MKYSTGEEVRLLDKVECQQCGVWFPATVVYIEQSQDAVNQLAWLIEERPEWAKGTIAIKWNDYESVKGYFFANEEAAESADASILFTGTKESDELRFIGRKS
jgi:hypothetical protein